jgi:hypothetical protein
MIGGRVVDVVARLLCGTLVVLALDGLASQRHTPNVRARLRRAG